MYRNIVIQPPSVDPYLAKYNQPHLGGHHAFTFIDTCKSKSRMETDRGEGRYENTAEAEVVESALRKLLGMCKAGELDN